jgi:hypothetical protein
LFISPVINATGYEIYVDGAKKTTATKATVDLSTLELAAGTHNIVVKANKANGTTSDSSNSAAFYVGEIATAEIQDSWEEIIAAVEDGTYSQRYGVGAYKPLELANGTIVNMQIAAIDGDNKTGGGKAAITWISKELVMARRMNATDSNAGGWEKSDLRQYLNNDMLALLPENIQNAIVAVNKTSFDFATEAQILTSDKIWLPSYFEVGNFNSLSKEQTGVTYSEIFAKTSDFAKTLNGTTTYWWLRSSSNFYDSTFYCVNSSSGSVYVSDRSAGSEMGVALCFCIGA